MDQPTAVLTASAPSTAEPPMVARSRPRWPGILSFGLSLLTVAGLVTGLVLVVNDRYPEATYAAWAATGVSGAAIVLALVALIGRFGRSWAVVGLAVAIVANPPVLTRMLDVIGGTWA